MALADGNVTDKERGIILRKAEARFSLKDDKKTLEEINYYAKEIDIK